MIFLTVGHQSPFDRLVKVVDTWAAQNRDKQVFAQIGNGDFRPRHAEWTRWLTPAEFDARLNECEAVVAHAGTGTIIQVLLKRKPLLVLPRLACKGETRNDHQVGTARHFSEKGLVQAACDEEKMLRLLDAVSLRTAEYQVSEFASPQLIRRLRDFLATPEILARHHQSGTV